MSHVTKGITLALANTLVLAGGYADLARETFHHRAPDIVSLFVVGAIPAIALGALLGALAGRLRSERLPMLLVASAAVLLCASVVASPLLGFPGMWDLPVLVALAWVPTSFATVALERWTRPPEIASAWVVAPAGSGSGSREPRARTASCT
jgi:hypothetical protein